MKHFQIIILLYLTFEWNRTYHEWRYRDNPDLIIIPHDQDDIVLVLKHAPKRG